MRTIDLFKKEILHVYYVLLSWKKTIQIALEKVKKIMLFAFFFFFFWPHNDDETNTSWGA